MSEQSLSNTDVFKMVMECRLDIFTTYELLGIAPDPTTQRILTKIKNAKNIKEVTEAVTESSAYAHEMGGPERGVLEVITDPEEIAHLKEQYARGDILCEISLDPALREAELILESGIPWGTQNLIDNLRLEAVTCDKQELIELFESIPSDARSERALILHLLATRYFQKPTASS